MSYDDSALRPLLGMLRQHSWGRRPVRYLAKMGVRHLATSKDGGQELKSHLRKDPVPLDLGPQDQGQFLEVPLGVDFAHVSQSGRGDSMTPRIMSLALNSGQLRVGT